MTQRMSPNQPDWLETRDLDFISSDFELLEQIPEGGMGVLYHAIHLGLDMEVAIKVVRQGHSTDRFLREGKLLAKLDSPYVVKVYDLKVLPSGSPMLVMQWIDGKDLSKEMDSRDSPLTEDEGQPWMRDCCLGMIAAEERHIVHRDLKPSNILIDSKRKARVADFGLARDFLGRPGSGITMAHDVLGTPYYMAPEQAEHPRSVDTRADIYSFGATFYHALTGSPPFEGDTILSVLMKHKMDPLISPRSRRKDLSNEISQILEKCMAKSPNDRFQSFGELLVHFEGGSSDPWGDVQDEELAGYLSQYESHKADYFKKRTEEPGEIDVFRFPNDRVLRIVAGSIAEQNTEAIVSSDDGTLTMGGGVSRAIRKAAGQVVRDEAARYAPVRPGRAVVTSAGDLPSRFVLHGVTMGDRDEEFMLPSRDLIYEIIKSCLYHAETLSIRSISFPLLGTGLGVFSKEECLDATFNYLARILLRGVTPLTEARIVLYFGPGMKGFLDELIEKSSAKNS